MFNKSESIANLAIALAKFNGEVSKISKDSNNPFFKSKYASLDNIIDEVRPILTKHGLSIMQLPGGDGDNIIMKSLLLHESGEWIESDALTMKPVKNDPQAVGSAITYARRYSIAAFLSLNTGEDDDGNNATHPTAPQKEEYAKNYLPILKSKYEAGKGSLEGYDDWVKKMQGEGKSYADMEKVLTAALNKKKQEEQKGE